MSTTAPSPTSRRRRRLWPWVLLALFGLLAGGAIVGLRMAHAKAGELVRRLAAERGIEASWSEIELGLDGRVAIVGLTFRTARGGRFEGEVARVEARLTWDDLWERRRPTDFHLSGLRLRVDREGLSGLADGEPEADAGAAPAEGAGRALRLELADVDVLAHLDESRVLACHADGVQIERDERVVVEGTTSCRAPELGLDSGPLRIVASYDPSREDPIDLLVEPPPQSTGQVAGLRFVRARASGGPDGARLEVEGLALADASRLPELPVQIDALSLEQLTVEVDRPHGRWEIGRLQAGPGALSLVRPAPVEEEPALAPGSAIEAVEPEPAREEPQEEVLALEEASVAAEEETGPAIDWPRLEAHLEDMAHEIDGVLRRATSLAREVSVEEIELALRTGSSDPLLGAVRSLSARPGLARIDAELAGYALTVTVEDVAEEADGDLAAVRMVLDAPSLDLGRISQGMGRAKLFTGHLETHLEITTGASLEIDLRVASDDLVFYHPAVSPRTLAFEPLRSETQFRFAPAAPERLRVASSGTLGEAIAGQLAVAIQVEGDESALEATFHVDEVDCEDMLRAIPEGMFVHMPREEIEIEGRAGLDGDVRYTFGNPRSFRLRLAEETFPGTCMITRLPEGYDPTELLSDDYVRQVPAEYLSAPEVEVLVGPGTPGWVPLADMPPYLRAIMYFTEQRRFYDEPAAVSISLINKAVRVNLMYGRWAYGGSTITQQLVKNLFFDRDKTLARKLEEALVAWAMFEIVPQDRILELYINCIEFGPDIWGIEAAAQYYFGVHAPELTPIQATYLAGLKPSPLSGASHRRRGTSPPRQRWRDRLHDRLQQLADAGFIDQAYVDAQAPYIIEFPDPDAPAPDPDLAPTREGPLVTPFDP